VPQCYAAACGPVKRARLFAAVIHLLLFALGVLLGPATGILHWPDATAAEPFIAICCGVAGAGLAARLDARAFTAPALAAGMLGAGAVAVTAGLLLRFQPAVAADLGGTAAVALALAGIAVAPRSVLAPALLAAAIALSPARRPPFGLGLWALLLVLAAALTALAYRALAARPPTVLPPAAAFTALLVGAGLGTATGTSPLLVCWGAALALGAASPGRSALRVLVLDAERATTAVLWFCAGMIANMPSWRFILVALALAMVPLLVARVGRWSGVAGVRPPEPVALALAWALALVNGRGLGPAAPLVTTAALGLLSFLAAPALASFVERLTRRRGPVEVTA